MEKLTGTLGLVMNWADLLLTLFAKIPHIFSTLWMLFTGFDSADTARKSFSIRSRSYTLRCYHWAVWSTKFGLGEFGMPSVVSLRPQVPIPPRR